MDLKVVPDPLANKETKGFKEYKEKSDHKVKLDLKASQVSKAFKVKLVKWGLRVR